MTSTNPTPQALNNHIIAWIRNEIAAQDIRLTSLRELCDSMSRRDPQVVEETLARVEKEDESSRARETKRKAIFEGFGEYWQVNPNVLTLRSIAERMGDTGADLMALRLELAEKVKSVNEASRMVSATAHMHRAVILDVLNVLFDGNAGDPLEEQGRLLDAEA
ncbi:MAG: hypothetical protein GY930_11655 [bacterium]|nr:hypothetical protein [bacterium]